MKANLASLAWRFVANQACPLPKAFHFGIGLNISFPIALIPSHDLQHSCLISSLSLLIKWVRLSKIACWAFNIIYEQPRPYGSGIMNYLPSCTIIKNPKTLGSWCIVGTLLDMERSWVTGIAVTGIPLKMSCPYSKCLQLKQMALTELLQTDPLLDCNCN